MMDMVSVPNGPKVLIHLGFVHEEACCEWDLRLQNLVTVIILAAKHHLVSNMTQQCSRHVKTLENDSLWPSWSFSKIINYKYIPCQALGWLKTFGQFLVLGGVLVHDWCKPGASVGLAVFCASTSRCPEQEIWRWKTNFLVSNFNFFGESLVLRIHFLGFRMHFLGFGNFDETS